ncbi:MAG: class I SAM-dependent methyltransferase [Planctomycetota bacterium]
MQTAAPQIDLAAMKAKQHAAWSAGDYGRIGTTLQIVGEQLAEAVHCSSGQSVLDVAAGNGNATLAFARRFCEVTSTDYVPALLEAGRARADAEGLPVQFQVADAEDLPFDSGGFDIVTSVFGVMFTADQQAAAGELMRVCRPGGTIGMANWTPDSFVGRLFKIIGAHTNAPASAPKPPVWGTEAWLRDTFGARADAVSITPRDFVFYHRSPKEFVDFFRTWYGPTLRVFESLGQDGGAALEHDFLELIHDCNAATDGTMKVPSGYLEVVISMH